jgi:hypothetical protein
MLSEIRQTQKNNNTCFLSYIDSTFKKKRYECKMENVLVGPVGGVWEKGD